MATNKGAYQQKLPNNIHSGLLYTHRMYAGPIDDTEVWNTLEDLQAYIQMPGTYAYPGQTVTVANGSVDTSNGKKDYDTYIIRSDMTLQKVSGTKRYESLEDATQALPNLSVGDMVLVWDNTNKKHVQYTVDATTDGSTKLNKISFDASSDLTELSWEKLAGKPTSTVSEIDASVTLSKKFTEPDPDGEQNLSYDGKEIAYKENIPSTYDATKITGVISPENLPKGAFDILHTVATEDELKNLTTEQVQTGDTVFVSEGEKMYFVKDDSKLGHETDYMQAFQTYNAGAASSVQWSGVQNKPTTVDGYGITDGVKTTDVADVVTANKIVKANQEGKIEGDITGDAGTVGGKRADELVLKTDVLTRSQLPPDVSGDCIEVDNQPARFALVKENPDSDEGLTVVHKGFLVRQKDTSEVFCVVDVDKLSEEAGYVKISISSSKINEILEMAEHENRATLDQFAESGEHTDGKKRPKFDNNDMALLSDCKKAALNLLPIVESEPESGDEGEFCLVKIKDV